MIKRLKIFILLMVGLFSLQGCFKKENVQVKTIEPRCISSQSVCSVNTPEGRFNISFDQENPIAETPFNLYVDYEGEYRIKSLTAHMEGVDMFMGKIPLFFEKISDKSVQGSSFFSQVLFGSCSLEKMKWKIIFIADVEHKNNTKTQSFFIEFTSTR